MERLIFWLANLKFRYFEGPKLVAALRSQGKNREADALDKLRFAPAPRSRAELIQGLRSRLVAQGRWTEAKQIEEIARYMDENPR